MSEVTMNDVVSAEPVKYGIEDLWTLVQAVIELGNVAGDIVDKAKEGEALKWYDKYLFPFAKLGDDVVKLFTVNYHEVIPAFKDIDDAERAELMKRAVEKFDIPQDKVEAVVEASFQLIFKLGEIVKEIIEMVQALKKPQA